MLYDLRYKFGQSPTIGKFNPPGDFSQFSLNTVLMF